MKRFFSLFLCLLMLISLLPISALAEEDAGTGTTEPEAGDAGRDDFGNDGTDDTGTGEIDETGMDDVGNVGTDDAGNAVDFYISEHDIAMNAWETAELFTNLGGESVIWISEDEEIASVDEAGTVTAHRQGNTVITAVADLPGGPAEDSCDIEVLSTGYLCRSPDELESSHPYAPGEDAVWQYTLPGASELLVSFDEQTALDEGSFLILADGEGEELVDEAGSRLSFSGEWLPDRPIRLPGDTFRIYLFTNPDGEGAWGFRVTVNRKSPENPERKRLKSRKHRMRWKNLTNSKSLKSGRNPKKQVMQGMGRSLPNGSAKRFRRRTSSPLVLGGHPIR